MSRGKVMGFANAQPIEADGHALTTMRHRCIDLPDRQSGISLAARVRPREPGILVNVKLNLPSEFNLIWAVQSHPQK
jgi:hypothetical protein